MVNVVNIAINRRMAVKAEILELDEFIHKARQILDSAERRLAAGGEHRSGNAGWNVTQLTP